MSIVEGVVEEFGRSIGLGHGAWAEKGHLVLDISSFGRYHLECRDGSLIIYLAREIDVGEDRLKVLKSALAALHYREGLPVVAQCGLHHASLVFLVRLSGHEVSLPAIEQAMEALNGLQEAARA